jgi:ribose transport system substrate-binding protein
MTSGVHRKGTRIAIAAAITAAAFGMTACGSSDDDGGSTGSTGAAATSGSTQSGGSKEKANIAAFIVDSANPYDTSLSNALKEQAGKEGADIQVYSADNDPQKQVSECSDALATQKFNVFVIKAVSGPTVVPCAREAIGKGIVVVAVDSPLGPEYTTKPQVDGIAASVLALPTTNGKALANMTADACAGKDPCKVAYYNGPPAFVFASQSRQAFLDTLKSDHPEVQVVDQASSNFDTGTGYTLTKSLLAKEPDIDVITADSEQSAQGSIKALKETGKMDQVKVIGGGGSKIGVAAIKAGDEYGTSALYPATLGRTSVELGIKALNGEDLGKTEYDIALETPIGAEITKDNVDKFKPEWG